MYKSVLRNPQKPFLGNSTPVANVRYWPILESGVEEDSRTVIGGNYVSPYAFSVHSEVRGDVEVRETLLVMQNSTGRRRGGRLPSTRTPNRISCPWDPSKGSSLLPRNFPSTFLYWPYAVCIVNTEKTQLFQNTTQVAREPTSGAAAAVHYMHSCRKAFDFFCSDGVTGNYMAKRRWLNSLLLPCKTFTCSQAQLPIKPSWRFNWFLGCPFSGVSFCKRGNFYRAQ